MAGSGAPLTCGVFCWREKRIGRVEWARSYFSASAGFTHSHLSPRL
jgi:hypothetical protein